jgi:hypothetical protein
MKMLQEAIQVPDDSLTSAGPQGLGMQPELVLYFGFAVLVSPDRGDGELAVLG